MPIPLMLNNEFGSVGPSGFKLALQEAWSIHDSINIPKIELIAYIYILL